jgi:hypothetical protein
MMSAHCVRVQRGTEQLVLANLKTVQAAHRLVALAAHASLMIVQPARVVKMAQPLDHVAQMIARRAQEAIAIVRHVHAAQMIVQPRVAVVRVREEVVRQRAVVAQAKVVVVRLLADQQRDAVGHSVMMIVQ